MKLTTYLLPLCLMCVLRTPSFAAEVKPVQQKGAMADEALTKALQPYWQDVTYIRRLVLINSYGRQYLGKTLPQDVARMIAQYCKIAWQWRAISSEHLLDRGKELNYTYENCQFIDPVTVMYRKGKAIHTLYWDEDSGQLEAYVSVLRGQKVMSVASLYLASTPTSVVSLGIQSNHYVLYGHAMNKGKLGAKKLYKTYGSLCNYEIENLGPNLVVVFKEDDPNHDFTLMYKRGHDVVFKDYTSSKTKSGEIKYKAFYLSKQYLFLTFLHKQKEYYYVWRCELEKILLGRCPWTKKRFKHGWVYKVDFMTYGDDLYCVDNYALFRIDHGSSKKEIEKVPVDFANFAIIKAVPLEGGFLLCTYKQKYGNHPYKTGICKIGDNDTLEAVSVNGMGYVLLACGFGRAMVKWKSKYSNNIVCQMVAFC